MKIIGITRYLRENIDQIANERCWDCKRENCPGDCRATCGKYRSGDDKDCRPFCRNSCFRNCEEKARRSYCPRMRDYARYINELSPYLNNNMAEITFDEVTAALNTLRDRRGYAEATVRGIQSCISVIFAFAENRHGFYDIMKYGSFKGCKKDILSILTSGRSQKAILCELTEQREQYRHKTKSLTVEQLEKLTRILWNSIEADGRYCMIALMLYTGIRPAEGRALMWKDIVPFLDHPDRWLLNLYKTRDKRGTLKQRMKTPNAYRRIPVHFELIALLEKRRQFVQKSCPGTDISSFPVCCFENLFHMPCLDYQVCQLTDTVFASGLKLKKEDMYVYMLDAEIEKRSGNSGCADQDQQLTLYVLRRAFWTWCEALTSLADFEKRYIMGHDMKVDNHSVHSRYNDENLLWSICQKLDRCVLSKALHEESLFIRPTENGTFQVENRGIIHIHLSKDMLSKGGTLRGSVTTEEAGEAVSLLSRSTLRQYGKIAPCAEVLPAPVKNAPTVGINCEYENWLAHMRCARSSGGKKDEKSSEVIETAEQSHDEE